MLTRPALVLALVAMPACAPASATEPSPAPFAALQCNDCHAIPGVATPPRTESCSGCHAWVRTVAANPAARQAAMTVFPKWERYERNVKTYFAVPDLAVAAARLDPAWVRSYLEDPYDTRPAMPETMVRLGADAASIESIVAWFTVRRRAVPASPAPDPANIAAGAKLFAERGCTACHAFGGAFPGPGIPAAPDLQHARDKMTDDALVAWIQAPSAFGSTTMPDLGLTLPEAVAVRDYLVLADPRPRPSLATVASSVAPRSPVAEPRWEDVESHVFGTICVHCHMDPAQNEGRAGPGNAGGFGWPATGLELQTYASVRANGPAILAALHRREGEAARDYVQPGEAPAHVVRPEKPGMPLGLPPIQAADIAMVELWYARGAPE